MSEIDKLNLDLSKNKKELLQDDVITHVTLIENKINEIINEVVYLKEDPEALENAFGYADLNSNLGDVDYGFVEDAFSIDLLGTINTIVSTAVDIRNAGIILEGIINPIIATVSTERLTPEYDFDATINPVLSCSGFAGEMPSYDFDGTVNVIIDSLGASGLNVSLDFDGIINNLINSEGVKGLNPSYNFEGKIDTVLYSIGDVQINAVTDFEGLINNVINSSGFASSAYVINLDGIIDNNITSNGELAIIESVNLDGVINHSIGSSGEDITTVESVNLDGVINHSIGSSGEDIDITKPVITLLGNTNIYLDYGETYNEPGYTAIDNKDGDITNDVIVTGSLNVNVVGTYTKYYNVTDEAGNVATQRTRTIHVQDTAKPVITLIGDSEITVGLGENYSDPGATAYDSYDGNITSEIVTLSNVNTDTEGTYSVIYNVTDSNGNSAITKTRTVNVVYVDTVKPVITLDGLVNVYIALGAPYNEPGYTATDNYDGDITNNVVVTGTIDNSTIGTYQLSYNVADAAGNNAITKTRNVIVEDVLSPGITLIGSATWLVELHSTWTDPGATAYDDYDGDITANIVVGGDTFNRHVGGVYTITYDVTDSSGNEAIQKTRTVTVYDPGLQ